MGKAQGQIQHRYQLYHQKKHLGSPDLKALKGLLNYNLKVHLILSDLLGFLLGNTLQESNKVDNDFFSYEELSLILLVLTCSCKGSKLKEDGL